MTDLTPTVRLATPEDLETIAAREPHPNAGFAQRHLDLVAAGDYYLVGAFGPDDIQGYVALDCRPSGELLPEMKSLWVFPEYRRRGLGARLTRFIEDMAADKGFDEVYLSVDPDNPAAIPLYISLDYTPTGDHRQVTYRTVDAQGRDAEATQTEAVYRKSLRIGR